MWKKYVFNISILLCLLFIYSSDLLSQTVVDENIRYNIKINEDAEVVIKAKSPQISFVEVYRNFPDMELVKTIDFSNSRKNTLENLTNGLYIIAFKRSDGKALAIETIKLD